MPKKSRSTNEKYQLSVPLQKRCTVCGITRTPQWREGPLGPKTLCNACGVKHSREKGGKRKARKINAEQSPLKWNSIAESTKNWCLPGNKFHKMSPSFQHAKSNDNNGSVHAQSLSPSESETQFDKDDYQAAETILCISSWESKQPFSTCPSIQPLMDSIPPYSWATSDAGGWCSRHKCPAIHRCETETQPCSCIFSNATSAKGNSAEPSGVRRSLRVKLKRRHAIQAKCGCGSLFGMRNLCHVSGELDEWDIKNECDLDFQVTDDGIDMTNKTSGYSDAQVELRMVKFELHLAEATAQAATQALVQAEERVHSLRSKASALATALGTGTQNTSSLTK